MTDNARLLIDKDQKRFNRVLDKIFRQFDWLSLLKKNKNITTSKSAKLIVDGLIN